MISYFSIYFWEQHNPFRLFHLQIHYKSIESIVKGAFSLPAIFLWSRIFWSNLPQKDIQIFLTDKWFLIKIQQFIVLPRLYWFLTALESEVFLTSSFERESWETNSVLCARFPKYCLYFSMSHNDSLNCLNVTCFEKNNISIVQSENLIIRHDGWNWQPNRLMLWRIGCKNPMKYWTLFSETGTRIRQYYLHRRHILIVVWKS